MDLVGHDRRPAAFVEYLFLLRRAVKLSRDTVSISLTARRILCPWDRDASSRSAIPPERDHHGNAVRRQIARPVRDVVG